MKNPKPPLDELLKKATVPSRESGYWEDFPARVTRELRRHDSQSVRSRSWNFPRWVWVAGTVGCLTLAFVLGFLNGKRTGGEEGRLAAARQYYKEFETLFPNQVRAIILEKNGPRLVLSETATVPDSPPLYVKVCQGKSCRDIITFSGQQIEINGEKYDVLMDGSGHVILAGNKTIWSSKDRKRKGSRADIEARPLDLEL